MKTVVSILTALLLLALLGCGGKEEAPGQTSDAEATSEVAAPDVDIHTAIVTDDLEAVRQHIAAGTDLNAREQMNQSTPLITAAAFGKTEAAKLLLDAGVEVDARNGDGSTALHTAAFFCHPEIVEALLAHGADKTLTNFSGATALQIVELPFEDIKPAYDMVGAALEPTGLVLDYERIKQTRPEIAELLR